MSAAAEQTRQTTIEASQEMPTITMTREFDAPVDLLFRAHTDGDLVARWMGPHSQDMVVEEYDATTGGSWRWHSSGEDGTEHHFYGSFHEVRPHERIVQTFTYAGWPDSVALEKGLRGSGRGSLPAHLGLRLRLLRGTRRDDLLRHGGRRRGGLPQAGCAPEGPRLNPAPDAPAWVTASLPGAAVSGA